MEIRIATQNEYAQLVQLDHHISTAMLAQILYRKLVYQDYGALLLPGEPLEIILRKVIG